MIKHKLDALNQVRSIYNYFSSIKEFSLLIPEVRTNISVATNNANTKEDVAAIEGRITVIGGFPRACGEIKFGVSDHTARLILSVKKFDNKVNIVMNLKYIPELIDRIKFNSELEIREIIRAQQPEDVKEKEHSTMQWLIKETFEKSGRIPDIIWDKGAKGKEPMIRLFGTISKDIIQKLDKILELI